MDQFYGLARRVCEFAGVERWNGTVEWTSGVEYWTATPTNRRFDSWPLPLIIKLAIKVVHTVTWSYQLAHMLWLSLRTLDLLNSVDLGLLWVSLASLVAHNSSRESRLSLVSSLNSRLPSAYEESHGQARLSYNSTEWSWEGSVSDYNNQKHIRVTVNQSQCIRAKSGQIWKF